MISNSMMQKGKLGLFGGIESSANLSSVKIFFSLEILMLILSGILYYAVPELEAGIYFIIFTAIMFVVSVIERTIIIKKEGVGKHLKWIIGVSYVISAVTTTSTMGVGGSILFVLPLLLSIQYCSLMYSIFMSVITVIGSFIPLLLTSFFSFYDLNVIKLVPGSVVKVGETLESSLSPEIININGTKINELLAIFLPAMMFVVICGVITCIVSFFIRKNILEQYRSFQNTRE